MTDYENFEDDDLESLKDMLESIMPNEYISIINQKHYQNAIKSIYLICEFLSKSFDEDDDFQYSIKEIQSLDGETWLALRLIIPEVGFNIVKKDLDSILSYVPDDAVITLLPRTDAKIFIEITYKKITTVIKSD